MIKMLNDKQRETSETYENLKAIIPVNHVMSVPVHITAIIINYNNNKE